MILWRDFILDMNEIKKLNLIVNKLSVIDKEHFFFSISLKKICTSEISNCEDAIKIETFPLFISAQTILDLINKNDIKVADLTFISL